MSLADSIDSEKAYTVRGNLLKRILGIVEKVEPWTNVEAHGLDVAVGEKKVVIKAKEASTSGGGSISMNIHRMDLTYAGDVPTWTEIQNSISAYFATQAELPVTGDIIILGDRMRYDVIKDGGGGIGGVWDFTLSLTSTAPETASFRMVGTALGWFF